LRMMPSICRGNGMSIESVLKDALNSKCAQDELLREVYCILGMPLDVVDMPKVLRRIQLAAASSIRLFLSTPNLNYLTHSQSDRNFRDTLLLSDLSPADGMSIVWLGRLLGVPIKQRVSGSDIFSALKNLRHQERPLKLFLFGGNEGVASAVASSLNDAHRGVECVGWRFPGFHSVEELSRDTIIDEINESGADFLVVCLGSMKGQLWLKRNYGRLRVPIRAHLGAALNFEAGTVRRAPLPIQKVGLEWLWRITKEPYLWKRYSHDGRVLLRLIFSKVLPLMYYRVLTSSLQHTKLDAVDHSCDSHVKVSVVGAATAANVQKFILLLRKALLTRKPIIIDLSKVSTIDSRFLGLFLILRKMTSYNQIGLTLTGSSPQLRKLFNLNGVEFLLARFDTNESEAVNEALAQPMIS
jgi:N-acetylglucosaminyldiphosphoundecaprenol N-acetyl-beta-D-mannosaminyltransferase